MKTVVLVGTLDTKGDLFSFVQEQLKGQGVETLVVDAGIRGSPGLVADISREEVAEAAGMSLAEVRAKGRGGVATMAVGAAKIVRRLYEDGRLDAIMGMGGAQNTTIACAAVQVLPLGVPKLIVSTVAAGQMTFGPYVGTKDVMMMHAVVDLVGRNSINTRLLTNAAHAAAGMAKVGGAVVPSVRPTVAATMIGMTTPCVEAAIQQLEGLGYEVITFHANGSGGQVMEELIREGLFCGVLDLTTHELSDHHYGGLMGGPNRLIAAGERGIPQVVGPGGIEMLVWGVAEVMPARFQGRPILNHNGVIISVRLNVEEMKEMAGIVAERLNASRGPVSVVLPRRGFCEVNRPGRELYGPEADAAFVTVLRQQLRSGISVVELDAHMNDPIVAARAVDLLHSSIQSHMGSS